MIVATAICAAFLALNFGNRGLNAASDVGAMTVQEVHPEVILVAKGAAGFWNLASIAFAVIAGVAIGHL